MFESLRHPGFRELNRYVDGDLRERDRARVAVHLTRCDACRGTVAKLRALGAVARELPTPAAPENLMELALQRRAAGERVILPLTAPGIPHRRTFALPIAAAAVAVLAVATVLTLHPPSLQAARDGLTITPAEPTAGAQLSLDYRDIGRFQGQQQLTVRARYRTLDQSYQLTAGVLDRGADGHFRGTITLPDSIVYAAFAVEDPAGRTVDSNGRELWDVTVHGPDGQPTFDALSARLDDLIKRDWEGAFAVARRMTELYPDRPAAWLDLKSVESDLDDSTALPRFRQRLASLKSRILAKDPANPQALAELAYGYFQLGQMEECRRLVARISAIHGWSRVRMRFRVSLLWIAAGGDNSRYRASLDSLWNFGNHQASLARAGLMSSQSPPDAEAMWTWYERLAAVYPDNDVTTLTDILLPVPAVRARAAHALEDAVRDGPRADTEDRPLYLPVPEYGVEERRELGQARAAVGTALLTSGRTGEALELIRMAVNDVWMPTMLQQAGQILLAHGDTAAAVKAYARMAANPALPPELRRAISNDLGALARSEPWRAAVASARPALEEDIFADRINDPVDPDLVLTNPSGDSVALSKLMSPGATAVVFWSKYFLPVLDSARSIERIRERLAAHDIRTIVIVTETGSAELRQALSHLHVPFPTYADPAGQAVREFVPPGSLAYYVLDGEGRIRFAYCDPDRIVEQAVMLKDASNGTVSAAD